MVKILILYNFNSFILCHFHVKYSIWKKVDVYTFCGWRGLRKCTFCTLVWTLNIMDNSLHICRRNKNTFFSWKIQRINTDNNALRSVLSVFDPAGNGATDGDCSDMVTIDSEVKCNLCNYVSTANENYYWDADIPGSEICISKYYYT